MSVPLSVATMVELWGGPCDGERRHIWILCRSLTHQAADGSYHVYERELARPFVFRWLATLEDMLPGEEIG